MKKIYLLSLLLFMSIAAYGSLTLIQDRREATVNSTRYTPEPFQDWGSYATPYPIYSLIEPRQFSTHRIASGVIDDYSGYYRHETELFDMTFSVDVNTELNLHGYIDVLDIWDAAGTARFSFYQGDDTILSNRLYFAETSWGQQPLSFDTDLAPGTYRMICSCDSANQPVTMDFVANFGATSEVVQVGKISFETLNRQAAVTEGEINHDLLRVSADLPTPTPPFDPPETATSVLIYDDSQISLVADEPSPNISTIPGGIVINFEGGSYTSALFRITAIDDSLHEGDHSTEISIGDTISTVNYPVWIYDNEGSSTNQHYNLWITSMGLTNFFQTRYSDDPNADGILNIGHFAFCSNPAVNTNDQKQSSLFYDPAGGPSELKFCATIPIRSGTVLSGSPLNGTADGIAYDLTAMGNLTTSSPLSIVELSPPLTNGLPSLETGWTYRTFYIPESTGQNNGFIRFQASGTP